MGRTHSTLRQTAHLKPVFYVRADDTQLDDYIKYAKLYDTTPFVYNPAHINFASQTYDAIIDREIDRGMCKYLIILDDDLQFKMPNPDIHAQPIFMYAGEEHIGKLFRQVLDNLSDKIVACSLCPILSRSQYHLLKFCAPLQNTYFYYLPHFFEHPEHRFWKGEHIEARCDLNLTLSLLTQGFLTMYTTTLLVNLTTPNNPGGCSVYRHLDVEKMSVEYLRRTWPQFVSLRKKRGWVDDPDVIRDAPFIKWRQAFNKTLFKDRFGVDALVFCKDTIAEYEVVYSEFMASMRNK